MMKSVWTDSGTSAILHPMFTAETSQVGATLIIDASVMRGTAREDISNSQLLTFLGVNILTFCTFKFNWHS